MKISNSIKKLLLFAILLGILPAQAGWMPQWLSQHLPEMNIKNSVLMGLSALTLTGAGIATYLWYQKYYAPRKQFKKFASSRRNKGKEKEIYNEQDNDLFIQSFATWKTQCDQLEGYKFPEFHPQKQIIQK